MQEPLTILDFIRNNKDIVDSLIIVVGWVLVIIGWFAAFLLGLRQQKKMLQSQGRIKVYEELFMKKKAIDDVCITLRLLLGKHALPFLDMSLVDKKIGGPNGKLEAQHHWSAYLAKLIQGISKFTEAYLSLWNYSDMWIGVMPKIKKAKIELFENQLKQLTQELNEHQRYLQDIAVKQFDWTLWNRSEIEERCEKIEDKFDSIAIGLMDDYMGLVHNRLVSPIFGYKKSPRETFKKIDKLEKYFILTEDGLSEIKVKK